jgi:hypothetical protein
MLLFLVVFVLVFSGGIAYIEFGPQVRELMKPETEPQEEPKKPLQETMDALNEETRRALQARHQTGLEALRRGSRAAVEALDGIRRPDPRIPRSNNNSRSSHNFEVDRGD